MPRIPGTTHKQTIFLRAFRQNPAGPPPHEWPNPALLRRWLRRPTFRRALQSLQDSLRFQADFHLSNLATQATQKFSTQDAPLNALDLNRLLRMSHLRQRFSPPQPQQAGAECAGSARSAAPDPDADEPDEATQCDPPAPQRDPDDFTPYTDADGVAHYPYAEGQARIREEALRYDYLPPIWHHPDFPKPTRQDTYYYKLLHNPCVLLFYMKCYAHRFPDDTRFARILTFCSDIVPVSGAFPKFEDHEPPPPWPHPNPQERYNPKRSFGDPDPELPPEFIPDP